MSHMDAIVVENLINNLKNHFGELVVTRGKKHKFLDMNKNITEDKKIQIDMKEQLLEAIEVFGENIDEKVTTPVYGHLSIVTEQAHQLDEDKRENIYLVVAKLLYIMRGARPDLKTVISF